MGKVYRDRAVAGAELADHLASLADQPDVTVLGLVRGGVPVAAVVAERLHAPLDVLVIRKLGVPWAPEFAFGAIGPGGVRVVDERTASGLDPADIDEVTRRESAELERRERHYRGGRPPLDLTGRTAVIVDDGLATGASARAAAEVARRLGARRIVLAVPVGAVDATDRVKAVVDELVCPVCTPEFGAVSMFYADFHEVSDAEVTALLNPSG
ncbi:MULTISPECIES: phosphoribosyltransferase family protein [Polymorphospora]|uniref:Phosphoribosyltransferase family protein n=1 Tax=Polymorphospora lycopeni TaxID=3140240 RepID=A0ABV5CHX2_9ACTN